MGKLIEKIKPGIRPLPEGVSFNHPHILIATWFGSGLLRPGSGTMGTLAALPFGYAVMYVGGFITLGLCALLFLYLGTKSAAFYGTKSGVHDNQAIVVDEAVGVWIAAIPAGLDFGLWIMAFILFRFFDITKPWPASYFDKKHTSALNVMLDDVVAGLFAFLGVATLALISGA